MLSFFALLYLKFFNLPVSVFHSVTDITGSAHSVLLKDQYTHSSVHDSTSCTILLLIYRPLSNNIFILETPEWIHPWGNISWENRPVQIYTWMEILQRTDTITKQSRRALSSSCCAPSLPFTRPNMNKNFSRGEIVVVKLL